MPRRTVCLGIALIALFLCSCAAGAGSTGPGFARHESSEAAKPAATHSSIGAETEKQKLALRRAVAAAMRDEAHALQQKGRIRDAVIRYRQSLVYWPDTGLEAYIAPLEQRAGFQALQYKPEAAKTSAAAGTGRVYATVRNRSARDISVAVRGEEPGAATTVRAGEIRILPVSLGPGGVVTFEIERDGKVLETRTWKGDPNTSAVVPVLLFDDALQGRLFVMTGLR
ncbi:MAG: hypothetical protein HPY67_01755 [Syntrophaceae bacterium]|nr:hypothetical protein [Syntrophaceae bacterium]